MKKVTVLGFGSWGIALACLLHKNGHKVTMWEPNESLAAMLDRERVNQRSLPGIVIPGDITITADEKVAAKAGDVVLLVLSSKDIPEKMKIITPHLNEGQIIVNASKGLIKEPLMRITEYLQDLAPQCKIACLSGPSHAEEVSRFLPTMVTVGSSCPETAAVVQDIFSGNNFRVYTSTDIVGVELGGVLKNVIALAAGISDGLGYGDNTKAALLTRGIAEIARLGIAMGAEMQTFAGLSGIGDLIVTGTSKHSRNWRGGNLLARGKSVEQVLAEVNMAVEGINTAPTVLALAQKYGVDMPIVEEVNKVLFEGKDPKAVVSDLMQRNKKGE
ncbi:MAG: NAD(P)-dependent glycerol-3-phosphate dehydrogenase [Defluviitaleaceae bacterium]|nr:NAD(P)-dependent glycerol-3-phosphate dehydrogenase [Defluviitaleaceae bacterium]